MRCGGPVRVLYYWDPMDDGIGGCAVEGDHGGNRHPRPRAVILDALGGLLVEVGVVDARQRRHPEVTVDRQYPFQVVDAAQTGGFTDDEGYVGVRE